MFPHAMRLGSLLLAAVLVHHTHAHVGTNQSEADSPAHPALNAHGPGVVETSIHRESVQVVYPRREHHPGDKAIKLKYDVAVIDVYFDRPLYLNGSIALSDAHRFLRLHRNHRQILYGTTMLQCGGRRVPSFPPKREAQANDMSDEDAWIHDERSASLLTFPLPSATDSEFRWLNAIAGAFNSALDKEAYEVLNRVSVVALVGFTDEDGHQTQYFTDKDLTQCSLHFLPRAEQRWPFPTEFTDASGTPVLGAVRITGQVQESNDFHLVESSTERNYPFDAHVSFLSERVTEQATFIKLLAAPIASNQLPTEVKVITDYNIVAFTSELFGKLSGFISGSTTPGAMEANGPPIYLQLQSWMLDNHKEFTRHKGKVKEDVDYPRFLETHIGESERAKAGTWFRSNMVAKDALAEHMAARFGQTPPAKSGQTPPATKAKTPGAPGDPIDGALTRVLITFLINDLTTTLTTGLTESLSESVSEKLHATLVEHLEDPLDMKITEHTQELTTPALTQTLSETIPVMLERMLPPILVMNLARTITHTVTRSLAHALVPTLTFTMKHSMQVEPFCYYCKEGQNQFCATCKRNEQEEFQNNHYTQYYTAFYSDYYADFFTGADPLKGGTGLDGGSASPPEHPSETYRATV